MTDSELRADISSLEPIPDADRKFHGHAADERATRLSRRSNWALGALGIILKLGLLETIAVIVLRDPVGCAIFAAFSVMGHSTSVDQMVLSRSAFGVRGAYLPSILMLLMTLGWIGVNTYFPVKIAAAILGQFGVPDAWLVEIAIITLVMAPGGGRRLRFPHVQKYTVPLRSPSWCS